MLDTAHAMGRRLAVGTKVRGIRLRDGVGDHDIECRIEGVSLQLKPGVVKRA